MKAYITAARLRTLPLAISIVAMGDICTRIFSPQYDLTITLWALLTAILLQILSNYANDYGDFLKGTDVNADRKDRVMASGALSEQSMLRAIITLSVISIIVGFTLLVVSFEGDLGKGFLFMFIMGLVAVFAAVTYTVGKYAYGYKAMGDIFVFLFFGPIAVMGSVYLQTPTQFYTVSEHNMTAILMAAMSMGFAASSVLNVNNIRDIEKDQVSGKTTIPILLGFKRAKVYHYSLLLAMIGFYSLFIFMTEKSIIEKLIICIGAIIVFAPRFLKMYKSNEQTPFEYYINELKFTSISIIALPLLAWL